MDKRYQDIKKYWMSGRFQTPCGFSSFVNCRVFCGGGGIDWWLLAAAIHFLATFIWDKYIFSNKSYAWDRIVVNEAISESLEHVIHIIGAKIIAFLLILLIWKTVYSAVSKIFSIKQVTIFLFFFIILSVIHLFYFPESFSLEIDNLITFSTAIRYSPYYWHGILTSMYYSACMNVLPHPIMIQEFSLGFTAALLTLCISQIKKMKLFAMILAFLPETWSIIINPYRNSLYCILLMMTVALFFNEHEKGGAPNKSRVVVYLFLLSILAVWRTEGVFFSIGLFVLLLVNTYHLRLKHLIQCSAMCFIFIITLSLPQKIGNWKYYGNDYTILTTINYLPDILNSTNANLSYEGISDDLEAIDKIAPLDWLKQSGIGGYRAYNFSCGREINQSCASNEDRSAYMKAVIRLVSHNIRIFINNRLNILLTSNKYEYTIPMEGYNGKLVEFPEGIYDHTRQLWDLGREELNNYKYIMQWQSSALRQNTAIPFRYLAAALSTMYWLIDGIRKKMTGMYKMQDLDWSIPFLLLISLVDSVISTPGLSEPSIIFRNAWSGAGMSFRFTVVLFSIIYIVYWLISRIRKQVLGKLKFRELDWSIPFLLLIGLLEIFIVTIGAPEARAQYYHPVYMYLLMVASYKISEVNYGNRER